VNSSTRKGLGALLAAQRPAMLLGITLAAALICLPAAAADQPADQSAKPASAAPKSAAKTAEKAGASDPKSQGSYAIGMMFGTQLHNAQLAPNDVSMERLVQGIKEAWAGTAHPTPADGAAVQALVEGARTRASTANQAAAKKFLAENAQKKDVVTTASGLQYKVVSPGTGTSPKPTDEVTVNYRGTLLDGTEFDSSYKRGQPATLQVNQVIRGWTEALQLMKAGSKYDLYIPPELGYGPNGSGPIPPNALLKFEVELLSFKPGAAPSIGLGPRPGMPPGGPGSAQPQSPH
jgi:FKBP-type peptidyl-prolyl cis-trans isomerase